MSEETQVVDAEELPSVSEVVPSQEKFDLEVLAQNIAGARQGLANAKFQYAAAKAGLPGTGGHLNQHAQTCIDAAKALGVMEQWAEEGFLPMPPNAGGKLIHLPSGA